MQSQEIQDFVLLFEIQKQIYRNEKEGERDHFKKEVIIKGCSGDFSPVKKLYKGKVQAVCELHKNGAGLLIDLRRFHYHDRKNDSS